MRGPKIAAVDTAETRAALTAKCRSRARSNSLGAAAHVGDRVHPERHPKCRRAAAGTEGGAPALPGVERIKIAVLVFVDGQPPPRRIDLSRPCRRGGSAESAAGPILPVPGPGASLKSLGKFWNAPCLPEPKAVAEA